MIIPSRFYPIPFTSQFYPKKKTCYPPIKYLVKDEFIIKHKLIRIELGSLAFYFLSCINIYNIYHFFSMFIWYIKNRSFF